MPLPTVNHVAAGTEVNSADPRTAFAAEPVPDLAGVCVAVLGCGGVGGLAAWACASAGVRTFDLADRDVLTEDNLRRHVCGRAELGRPKPDALAQMLGERFLGVEVHAHPICFLDDPAALRQLIEQAEVVLAAVDDEAPKHLIDSMARELGKPAIYAGVYGGGWATELIFLAPGPKTPCYGCVARALGRHGVRVAAPAATPAYALPARLPADGWHVADLTSILPCAALAARLVVAWLSRARGHATPWDEFTHDGACAWRLALRCLPAWELGPWQLRVVPVAPLPGCPTCGPDQPAIADLETLLGTTTDASISQ